MVLLKLDLSGLSVPAVTVFLQGLVSFFSPCVLPLLPVYLGYLAGGGGQKEESFSKGRTLLNTFFFVLGISAAFFLLGLGMTALGSFFGQYRVWFARIGGVIAILFGLYQLGVFGASMFLSQERRVHLPLQKWPMNPLTALVLGFFFSFAWTPCVGPTLTTVLLMAGSSSSSAMGFLLIGVYTLGFVLPFLLVGLFTTTLLGLFRTHMNLVRYTTAVGAVLMILVGVLMLSGQMEKLSGWAARLTASSEQTEESSRVDFTTDDEDASQSSEGNGPQADSDASGTSSQDRPDSSGSASQEGSSQAETSSSEESTESSEEELLDPIDLTLKDQYGNEITMSDYKGKIIFLNFWATWCGPCQSEMPEIQELYEKSEELGVQILAVCTPSVGGEMSEEEIAAFLEEKGYTFPVLMDTYGVFTSKYGITAIPTTFFITEDFKVLGYVSGAMDLDTMEKLIEETRKH